MHFIDVAFACNDLGLACGAYLGGSRLRIQEPWIVHCGVVVCYIGISWRNCSTK